MMPSVVNAAKPNAIVRFLGSQYACPAMVDVVFTEQAPAALHEGRYVEGILYLAVIVTSIPYLLLLHRHNKATLVAAIVYGLFAILLIPVILVRLIGLVASLFT
jgi:uncharacterized membrane protein YagU involved in acid resistance